MRAVFDLYDSTHTNSLSLGELTSMLDDLGMLKAEPKKIEFCTRIFEEYKDSRSSQLSFKDFKVHFTI